MTTYVIINLTILAVFAAAIGYLFYRLSSRKLNHSVTISPSSAYQLSWKAWILLLIAFLLVVASFFSPFIFTREAINDDFNFSSTGQIGDTIGGLMNPFIAIAGVIVTGLAFYIQYKANQQQREFFLREQEQSREQFQEELNTQREQIKIQQFESQFYQMLNFHRDNINEMKVEGYDFVDGIMNKYEKSTEGRKVFVTMKTELECILAIYRKHHKMLDQQGFEKCYKLFFNGIDEFEKAYPSEETLTGIFRKIRKRHENPESAGAISNKQRKEALTGVHLNFNYKPFSGHASRLGHYFRHLFLTVKSVVNSDIISPYEEKMRYLKVLRAQLSNHEQILLFYNWLSTYGGPWENEDNHFLTEYCMIHNLWHDILFDDPFITTQIDYLRKRPVYERKGEMFEID